MLIYLNNKFVRAEKARVSVFDHGFLYGDGIYETLRVYNGRVFQLAEHMRRLSHSARGIRLRLPYSLKKIGRAVEHTVKVNRLQEAVVRLTVSRGPGPYGFDPRPCRQPTLVIATMHFKPYPIGYHSKGIRIALVSVRRNSPMSLPPHVKSTSCLNGILAKMESITMKTQEAVMLTLDGAVAEGTVSNVFLVKGGRLLTPSLEGNLLAGVTRDLVCRLAKKSGVRVIERRLSASALTSADEIFLTNTTMEVMPVRQVVVSPGAARAGARKRGWKRQDPGPVTRKLMAAFTTFRRSTNRRNARLPVGENSYELK